MKSIDHLRALVEGLDSAFISSWQSTEKWQKQLDAARDFLAQNDSEKQAETVGESFGRLGDAVSQLADRLHEVESEILRIRNIFDSNT